MDYGHELEFGLFPSPAADSFAHLVQLTSLAEVSGLDLVSIQDHPYQQNYGDTWTLLSYLGARTSTIRLSPNVANLPLRMPTVLATSAATLDLLTGGRVELGLGTGAFWDGIVAAGGERRSPKQAVDALVEAIAVIRGCWMGDTVNVAGEHYRVTGFRAGPVPAHDIPIWLGAYKPRMLRVTGRLADAWVPSMGYADPPALPDLNAALDEATVKAGRSPENVRRIYNIFGAFGRGAGFLQGTADNWAEQLAQLTLEQGMSTYILGTDDPDAVRRFAEEVAPATRQLVAAERNRAAAVTNERTGTDERMATTGRTPAERIVPGGNAATSGGRADQPLTAIPTPDDGSRLTGPLTWDESARPTHDEPAGASYSREQSATAQHLIDVHDHLRSELEQVRDIVRQVREGHLTVGQARSAINTMTMRQNNWTLGAYCESYCRLVTGHHTLEDVSIFPHLRRSEPDLVAVIDRLESEHDVIHDVLDQVDEALVNVVSTDGTGVAGSTALDELQHAMDLLTDTMLSHLAYEERELVGPLARHGFQ